MHLQPPLPGRLCLSSRFSPVGVTTSKAAMARTIKAQGDRIAEQDAKIQSLEAYNAKLEERLAAIEAKIGK